jgi:chondroitin sulfate proteoglycan 4
VKRYQLIVGARDALFRLSLDGLTKLEMADWTASPTKVGLCTAKGQSDENCRNFVKELYSSFKDKHVPDDQKFKWKNFSFQ